MHQIPFGCIMLIVGMVRVRALGKRVGKEEELYVGKEQGSSAAFLGAREPA